MVLIARDREHRNRHPLKLFVDAAPVDHLIDGADREAGFTQAWYAVALTMLVAALVAVRLSSATTEVPEPVAVAVPTDLAT